MTETDAWYRQQGGFSYTDEQVDRWLRRWLLPQVTLRPGLRTLDLACGDGVWTFGLERLEPGVRVVGIDASSGAIHSARSRAASLGSAARFEILDIEALPHELRDFDLVFARGIPLFNQHDMSHAGCLRLLDELHARLAPQGLFFSSYGGRPALEGRYTPPSEVRLPLNQEPRRTEALDFRGGKFNHSQESFLRPFLISDRVELRSYRYSGGRHASVTALRAERRAIPPGETRC